jgi:hypothetical protein
MNNSLLVKSPDIALLWHPTHNTPLQPADVTFKSGKKVWWQCKRGHEFQAAIAHLTQGEGCPYCSGRKVSKDSLAAKAPEIAAEWHPDKNGKRRPESTPPMSAYCAWWQCKKGHEWQAFVYSRASGKYGCPYCSGRKATPETSLAALFPKIAAEWHPTLNGFLTPEMFRPGSNKYAWWLCKKGHAHRAMIKNKTNGTGCGVCYRDRNKGKVATPSRLLKNSDSHWNLGKNRNKVLWKCSNGHEWEDFLNHRAEGKACPDCGEKNSYPKESLASKSPKIAAEWHPEKNGKVNPFNIAFKSNCCAFWLCSKGHLWQARVDTRVKGKTGCPYCSGFHATPETCLQTINPDLAKEWHPTKNGGLLPENVTPYSNKKVFWQCLRAGHTWSATINNRSRGSGCPKCKRLGRLLKRKVFPFETPPFKRRSSNVWPIRTQN